MAAQVQFDLFEETTQEDVIKAEVEALKESHHAVRKKLFGQVGALTKMVLDQQQQLDYLMIKLNLACPVKRDNG